MLQLTYLHNISDVRMYISMPVDVSNAHIHKHSLKHRDTHAHNMNTIIDKRIISCIAH